MTSGVHLCVLSFFSFLSYLKGLHLTALYLKPFGIYIRYWWAFVSLIFFYLQYTDFAFKSGTGVLFASSSYFFCLAVCYDLFLFLRLSQRQKERPSRKSFSIIPSYLQNPSANETKPLTINKLLLQIRCYRGEDSTRFLPHKHTEELDVSLN